MEPKRKVTIIKTQNLEPDWMTNWELMDRIYTRVDETSRRAPVVVTLPKMNQEDSDNPSQLLQRIISIALRHSKYISIAQAFESKKPYPRKADWFIDELRYDLSQLGCIETVRQHRLDTIFSKGQEREFVSKQPESKPGDRVPFYGFKIRHDAAEKLIPLMLREKQKSFKQGEESKAKELEPIIKDQGRRITQLEKEISQIKIKLESKSQAISDLKDHEMITLFRDHHLKHLPGSKLMSGETLRKFNEWCLRINGPNNYQPMTEKKWGTLIMDHRIFIRVRTRKGTELHDYRYIEEHDTEI